MRVAAVVLMLFIGGCGFGGGGLRPGEPCFSPRGVQHVRTVSASSAWWSLFCAIPLDRSPRYKQTMAKLHKAAAIGEDQALVNMREDTQHTGYLVVCHHELTLSADVVQLRYRLARKRGGVPASLPARAVPGPPAKKGAGPCWDACGTEFWACSRKCKAPTCLPDCQRAQAECEQRCK